MSISRRQLLAGGSALGALAALRSLGIREALARGRRSEGYGPLLPDPEGVLDLPRGFSYKAFGRLGDPMSDGLPTPPRHDGMGAFRGPRGMTILVRNHEMSTSSDRDDGVRIPLEQRYDPGSGGFVRGGTTNLIVSRDNELLASYATLGGTFRNCAGGVTPWGTWLTSEETTVVPETDPRHTKRHGYNFEVPARASGPVEPVPLVAMGRFSHEAVAVDPRTGFVYETEDEGDSAFYRFRPYRRGRLEEGGVLEAMRLLDFRSGVSTSNRPGETSVAFPAGVEFEVDWVPIASVDPGAGDTPTRVQARERGAAIIRRGEGIWWSTFDDAFYFVSTDGGAARSGQIFRFTPGRGRGKQGTFELFLEASGPDTETSPGEWEWPDNLTVTPWGDLLLCEDGPGTQYLTIVTRGGEVFRFARNALNDSEFAGACFGPDGRTLFVNIYGNDTAPGVTLAVTGPWQGDRDRGRDRNRDRT